MRDKIENTNLFYLLNTMTEYQKIHEKEVATGPLTAAERYEKTFMIMNQMIKTKSPVVIREIERCIEDHLSKDANHRIPINYNSIASVIDYNFPAHVWVDIIRRHYEPLGFDFEEHDGVGMFIIMNPSQPTSQVRSCTCAIM